MTSIQHAAIAASVIVGLLSIPAASQTAGIPSAVTGDLPNVSQSQEIPRESFTRVTEDGFVRQVETAFNSFATNISSGSASARLENPGSRLEVNRNPSRTEWVLSTPSGTLEVVKTSSRTFEQTVTPQGTIRFEKVNGDREVNFTGSSREEVEQTHHDLLQLLKQKKQEIENRRSRMREEAMPDVELVANASTASGFGDNDREHVVVVNRDFEPVSLKGWKLTDESLSSHEFGEVSVPARGRLHVYSGTPEDPDQPFVEGTGISWNDGGDTATLYTGDAKQMAEETY